MLHAKRVIKVGIEETSGTQVAGTVAVLVEDLVGPKPTAPFEERNGSGLTLGRTTPGTLGEKIGTCSFTVELRSTASVTFTMPKMQYREVDTGERNGIMIDDANGQLNESSGNDFLTINKGAGTLGSGIDELLKASGFVLNSTTYSPHSVQANQKTISIDVWEDGRKKSLFGAQGKCAIEFDTGKRVLLKFEFSGNWVAVTDEALPAYAPGTTAVLFARGGAFTIGAAAKLIGKLSIDVGQVVVPRPDPNAGTGVKCYAVSRYLPLISLDPESELVAAYDIYGAWLACTEAAVVFTAA
jgi:hypothetical protein